MNYVEPVWAKYITEDNIEDETLKDLIHIIGFENVKKIMLQFTNIHVLVSRKSFMKYKYQYVLGNYDGTRKSRRKVALDCELTENYIYKLIKRYENKNERII